MTPSQRPDQNAAASDEPKTPAVHLAPSPHLADQFFTTRRMMVDVLIGLIPVMAMAVAVFRWYAVVQVGLCVLTCVATDAVGAWLRRRPAPVGDYSAAVTGVILGLSLPWSAPWYVAVIGSAVAISLGKAVFGGLGYNIFNPAMVGRAFVMLSFAREMGASAYQAATTTTQPLLTVRTQATPVTAAKQLGVSEEFSQPFWPLFFGTTNGSLGETSALALLIGGLYLCVRRVASWEIPVGVLYRNNAVPCYEDLREGERPNTPGLIRTVLNEEFDKFTIWPEDGGAAPPAE